MWFQKGNKIVISDCKTLKINILNIATRKFVKGIRQWYGRLGVAFRFHSFLFIIEICKYNYLISLLFFININ
jgi:hypothetical protein